MLFLETNNIMCILYGSIILSWIIKNLLRTDSADTGAYLFTVIISRTGRDWMNIGSIANIFGFRMMRWVRICGEIFGKQMKDHSIGTSTGIIPNLERMTRSNRYPLEIFILIVTSLRNVS
jgi:hypothetical protein